MFHHLADHIPTVCVLLASLSHLLCLFFSLIFFPVLRVVREFYLISRSFEKSHVNICQSIFAFLPKKEVHNLCINSCENVCRILSKVLSAKIQFCRGLSFVSTDKILASIELLLQQCLDFLIPDYILQQFLLIKIFPLFLYKLRIKIVSLF